MNKKAMKVASFTLLLFFVVMLLFSILDKKENLVSEKMFLNQDEVTKTLELKSKDKFIQPMIYNLNKVNNLSFMVHSNEDVKENITINLYNDSDKLFYSQEYIVNEIITIPMSQYELSFLDKYNIEVVNNSNYSINLDVVSRKGNQEKEVVYDMVLNVEGVQVDNHKNMVKVSLIGITLLFILNYLQNRKIINVQIDKTLILLKKYRCVYVVEFILSITTVLLSLYNFIKYTYYADLNILLAIINVLIAMVCIMYIIELLFNANKRIDLYFLVLAIPIGLLYLFFFVPNSIPDEIVHSIRTMSVANFEYSAIPETVPVPSSLTEQIQYNYNVFWKALIESTNYSDLIDRSGCNYNFILYIVPSLGFIIGKIFSLSIMASYVLARMFNFILFLVGGYYIINKTPIAKLFLLVYLLSPMMLQQSISLSADAMVNLVALVSIAHMLYICYTKDRISYFDILFLGTLFIITALGKYVYLPVFGLIFLSFDKLKAMNFKKWIMVASLILIAVIAYYLFNYVFISSSTNEAVNTYIIENNVNPSLQIQHIISHPIAFIRTLYQTFINYGYFYLSSVVIAPLSWLSIPIDGILIYFYFFLIAVSILVDKSKVKFNKINIVWILFLVGLMTIGVLYALYISWSPVGGPLVLGVQGRYFIPVLILVLLLFVGEKKLYLKRPNLMIISGLILVHVLTLSTVFKYFMLS